MANIKKVREQRNEALETMERIHNEYEGKELTEEAQKEWNEAKDTLKAKNDILKREELIENQKRKASIRNHNDGEQKELSKFSFMDAVKYAINPNAVENSKQGFYAELNREAEKEASNSGVTLQGGQGLVIPKNVLNADFRNDLTVGTEGTDIVYEEKGAFIDALKERLVLREMGAEYMDGLIGDVKFSKETNTPAFTWEGETDQNSEHTPTFGKVTLSPNRGGTYIDVSNQALKQTSPSVERRLRNQLVGATQRGLESAAIEGDAAGPNGIMDIASAVAGSGDYAHMVDLEAAIAADNADIGNLGYLTNAKARGVLKKAAKDSGSGQFVWEDGEVNGYQAKVSNLVLEDSDGAPENSPVIFGNFGDLIIGQWGGIELLVDPYTQATNGMTRLVLNVYADVGILHGESFAYGEVETTSA